MRNTQRLMLISMLYLLFAVNNISGQTYNMATYNGQTVNTCSGTFIDGGGAGAYGNNENYSVTFCSSSASPLKFDFSTGGSFDIDVAGDSLIFYDGTTATGTPIAILTYLDDNTQTGYSSQLKINTMSTCVTVVWKSNASGTDAGWSAVISCGDPPVCAGNPPAADIFGQATAICNVADYCGTTSTYYGEDTPFNLIGGGVCPVPDDGIFGATIENNSWLKFEALSTSATFDFNVTGGSCMSGIQAGVFAYDQATHQFSLKSPCALTDAGQTGAFTLTASSLTVGEIYYMMIDGYAGDNCDYTISVNTGVTIVAAGPDQAICDTFAIMAGSSPLSAGVWSVVSGHGDFNDITDPLSYVSGLDAGANVFVWTAASTFCGAVTDTVVITVTASAPINLTCGTSTTGSVEVTWNAAAGATGYDIAYEVNGGAPVNDNTTATTYTVNGLNPGDNVSVTVSPTGGGCYTDETISCSAQNASCSANAGTVSVFINGTDVTNGTNEYVLCLGDALEIQSDNNFTLPPAAGSDPAGLGYGFYTAAPSNADPALDAAFSGLLDYQEDISDNNTAGPGSPVFTALGSAGPSFWIVPFTLDDRLNLAAGGADDARGWDTDADDCFDLGIPMKFTYVNAITAVVDEDCATGSATVTISGGSPEFVAGAGYSIQLSGDGVLSADTLNTHGGNISVNGLSGGDAFSLTITDQNGCSVNVVLNSFVSGPSISGTTSSPLCYNNANGSIDLTASGGNGTLQYAWSHDASEHSEDVSGLVAGTYVVTVSDSLGCSVEETFVLSEPQLLVPAMTSTDINCESGSAGTALVTLSGGTAPYTYLWSNSVTTAGISVSEPGTYSVSVTDANGCDTLGSVMINEICLNIPDAFSPNADGVNDTWEIEGIAYYANVSIRIYNRWGQLVFEFSGAGSAYADRTNQWDGTYEAQESPANSFVYMLDLGNGESVNGIVTIIKE